MSTTRRCLPLAAALLLCACSSVIGKKEPFTIYAPRYAPQAGAASGASVPWQLAIDAPVANDALDTPRMLVMPSPGALETYPGGRWAATVPLLLRGLLIEAFQSSGRIGGVGASSSGLHADFLLAIDLYDFETQYLDGAPHAVIRLNAKLTDVSTNRIAASRMFEADAALAGADASAAAHAMQGALAMLLPEIVQWTLSEGASRWHPPQSSPPAAG